ncbi:hypothetical protein GCM10007269_37260 [Microbacterium murale]|uniref:DNA ligase D polymerase domain-containing protein n=2 Tax=Micrococcales TaxID=85006 RepID=A0ABQ1S525_9MICO|nr:hypothetical protein GCM10007269_37260 [Microbacterium murale]
MSSSAACPSGSPPPGGRKEERGERIFVDFNQANRDRTMAGAYSPRALPDATVSTPVMWDELDDAEPHAFTVRTVPQRLADVGDPWSGFLDQPGRIHAAAVVAARPRRWIGRAGVPAGVSEDARRTPARTAVAARTEPPWVQFRCLCERRFGVV